MGSKGSTSYQTYYMPEYEEAMKMEAQLAEKQQDWYLNEVYPWAKSEAEKNVELANKNREAAIADYDYWKQQLTDETGAINSRAQEYLDRWQNTYLPAEQKLMADSQKYIDGSYASDRAQSAADYVTQQYANQKQANDMQAASYGVDPNSRPDYTSSNRASAINQAGLEATAYNQAMDSASSLGWDRLTQLSALGNTYSGLSNAASGVATSASNTAGSNASNSLSQSQTYGNNTSSNVGNLNNIGLQTQNYLQNAWSNYGQQAKQIQDATNNVRAQAAQANANASGAMMGLAGTAASTAIMYF